jgi:CRP/FNR family cyclic AMP-dependent transcriptional regulator
MDAYPADSLILRSMKALEHHLEVQRYEPGEVIFASGDSGDRMFGILEGQVSLSWGDGQRAEVLGPDRCFGEGALLQSSHRRHGTAMALEACRLLVLNRETFLFALEALPMFAVELMASLEARLRDLHRTSSQPPAGPA